MEWLQKNFRYVIIILVILLAFSKCQSCNRDNTNKKITKEFKVIKDSLNNEITYLNDSIKGLNYKLQIANERASSADKRANSIQETAAAIKTNSTTTIKIENKTQDTNNSKNK